MVKEKGFQSEFVGRDDALKNLGHQLDESIAGKGQLVLVSGEAGVGKTRLIREFKEDASSKGVKCLEGACINIEVSDPYLPFMTALSQITTPSLVDESQKYVTIEEVFLINNFGIVVSHAQRVGANILDEDIVGSMLSAVEAFVKDAFGDEESSSKGLETLAYGTTRILIEHGKLVFLAIVLSGEEPDDLRKDLRELVVKIEDRYYDVLSNWDGDVAKVSEITKIISDLRSVRYKIKRSIRNIDIKKERDRVFERALSLIVEASQKEPLLLILEDIHWADISSLQLLQYIARNTREHRVMICGTYRPEELDDVALGKIHPLKETLLRMSRHKMFRKIELGSLTPKEVLKMLQSIFHMEELPPGLLERLYTETEGNPFFILEILNSYVDENIIHHDEGRWQMRKISDFSVPSTIKDLLMLRIERLDEPALKTLKHASVMGLEFKFEILNRTTEMDIESLMKSLESLEDRRMIHVDFEDDELYRFNHSMIREVVLGSLRSHRKRLIHQRVAQVLEEMSSDNIENTVYQLAHHYSQTRDQDKALKYSLLAGETASSEFAFDEAFGYYEMALGAVEKRGEREDNDLEKLKIVMHLGDISYVRGEWDAASDFYHTARRLSEKLENDSSLAESYRGLGLIHLNKNEWDTAQKNFEFSRGISEKIADFHGLANTYYNLGTVFERKGDFQKAIESYQKCMEIANKIQDSKEIARGYLGIGRVHAQKGYYDDSIESFKKAIHILEKKGDLSELSKAYVNLGASYFYTDMNESIAFHEKAIKLAHKMGFIRIMGYALMNKAYILIEKEELTEGLICLDKALKIFKKIDERIAISSTFTNYGCIYRLRKEWGKAEDYFEKAIEICHDSETPYYLGNVLYQYGLMLKEKGDEKEAGLKLEGALKIFRDIQNTEMIEKVKKEIHDF